MKIVLLGPQGQVGWELQRSLAPLGEVIALGREGHRQYAGLTGDLSQPDALVWNPSGYARNVIERITLRAQ